MKKKIQVIEIDDEVLCFASFGKIYVGEEFRKLPNMEQRGLLLHEEGHIRHRHQLKRLLAVLAIPFKGAEWFYGFCRRQELEADRYSVLHGGAYGMLQFFLHDNEPLPDPYYPNYQERVVHIAECMVLAWEEVQ